MGERANVCIEETTGRGQLHQLFLYSHWDGSWLAVALKNALLRGRERWSDYSYLSRIIFCEMIREDVCGTKGYGISPFLCDNEYQILYVLPQSKQVRVGVGNDAVYFSFQDYVQLPDNDCCQLMEAV